MEGGVPPHSTHMQYHHGTLNSRSPTQPPHIPRTRNPHGCHTTHMANSLTPIKFVCQHCPDMLCVVGLVRHGGSMVASVVAVLCPVWVLQCVIIVTSIAAVVCQLCGSSVAALLSALLSLVWRCYYQRCTRGVSVPYPYCCQCCASRVFSRVTVLCPGRWQYCSSVVASVVASVVLGIVIRIARCCGGLRHH